MHHALPALLVAVPLLAAAFLAAVNRHVPRWMADTFALLASISTCAGCAQLMLQSSPQTLVYWFGGWAPRSGAAIGIAFVIDPFGAGLAAFAAALVTVALIFSLRYFDSVGNLYHVLMMAFLGAMCAFCLTGDLFNLFVWFELMSAAAFALCGYKTEQAGPLEGSLNFAITNTIGAFLVLSGIGLLYGRTGALNMAQVGRSLENTADGLVVVAFVLILCGFAVKAALVPFHFWLADAHAVAPTPVCILFSGVMVELGLYAIARVYWTVFQAAFAPHVRELRALFLSIGVITALLGAVMCFSQRHLKRLLAFSTISHMGLMTIGFGLLSPLALGGTALYLLGHGTAKSALFIGAGIILHRLRTVDELKLHARGKKSFGRASLLILAALGLAGVPPYGTLLGEAVIDHNAEQLGFKWVSWIFIAASVITAAAVFRVLGNLYFGLESRQSVDKSAGDTGLTDEPPETNGSHHRTPALTWVPLVVLVIAGVGMSFIPHLRSAAHGAASRFQDQSGYEAIVLDHAALPSPQIREEAPLAAALWRGGISTAGALLLAAFSLARRRLFRRRRWENALPAAMHPLRRLHSGLIGDYVAWLTFGAAAFGVLCFWLIR